MPQSFGRPALRALRPRPGAGSGAAAGGREGDLARPRHARQLPRVFAGGVRQGRPARPPSGWAAPQESTLIGTKARAGAASAVLANATLAHGLDFDDTREDAIVHTGCVAVTTALAVGEALGASGRAVLEAMIAGVEVMCRVGLAVPGSFHARHYHPTSLTGGFAAAAVAGKLYGLTEDQLVHAFGICGSQAGGIIEYLADGSWTKRLHPGWAAHAGVVADAPRAIGVHRSGDGLRGRARLLPGVRRRLRGARLEALLASLGRDMGAGRADAQALSLRLHRPAVHGLRAPAPRAAPDRARADRRHPLPHRRGPDPAPLGAAREQAHARPTATPPSSACPICSR